MRYAIASWRLGERQRETTASGQNYEFTSQLYFGDAITDRVYMHAIYASSGPRTVKNDRDGIYRAGGDRLMLALTETEQGYDAGFDVGLDIG